ncbi:MAG TPA: hypothetical protein VMT17_07245 [Anaeromyxobacteraceae bacterium]|nr:hypothetical protein [Anaeromyxobacteraceae bacterium]
MRSRDRRSLVVACLASLVAWASPSIASASEGPPPPENLVVDPFETEVFLKWSRPDGQDSAVSYEVLRGQSLVARTTSLVATDVGLSPDSSYCYSVVALDGEGRRSTPAGPVCQRTLDTTPPSAPAALSVEVVSPTEVALRWDPAFDNVGVAGYEVLRGDRLVASVEGTTSGELRPRPGHFCYVVRAFDRAGNRSPPSAESCVDLPDVTPPSVPAGLQASPGRKEVSLSWEASKDDVGVAGYEVLAGEAVVATARPATAAVGDLAAGEHCFSVRAFDRAGNRSPASEAACATVPDTTPPSAPQSVVATAPGEMSVVLRWAPSTDDVVVAGYEVLRGEKVVARSTEPAAGDDGLRPAEEYCYRVRALDAAGNRSELSPPACVLTPDLTPPSVPQEPVAEAASDRAARLRWKASTDNVGVAVYEILRDGAVVARSEAPQAEDQGLRPAREYCYAVRALDRAGNASAPSGTSCIRTPDLAPPTVPGGVAVAGLTPTRLAVAWEASKDDVGVAGYEVMRGAEVLARVADPGANLDGLSPATEYCLRVRAFDSAGNISLPSPPSCGRTGDPGSPSAPVSPRARALGSGKVLVTWTPSREPSVVYTIYWDRGQRIGVTRYESYRVAGLKVGERRCFRITASTAGGATSPMSAPACVEMPVPTTAAR